MIEPQLREGDIFATRGRGVLAWLSRHLIAPSTPLYHFGLVGAFIGDERGGLGDYCVLDTIGLLFYHLFYHYIDQGIDVWVFRPIGTDYIQGKRAVTELSRLGRAPYDWLLPLKVACWALGHWMHTPIWRWGRLDVRRIPYERDMRFLCTEAVVEGYLRAGLRLVPKGVIPLPASLQIAIDSGFLIEVAHFEGRNPVFTTVGTPPIS